MRRSIALMVAVALACWPVSGRANTPNHSGVVYSLVAGTATALTSAMLTGTCAYAIQNNDTEAVYLWFDSTVTNTKGIVIAANGGQITLTITYQSIQAGTTLWVYSVGAGTSSLVVAGAC